MFGPSTKKQKLETPSSSQESSGSATSKGSPSGSGVKRNTFNSIPFSLSAFRESLTEDQKRLLALECDTIGKSWLKVLTEELKKPYFIQLKEFLWQEGVRDASHLTPKVFPPAKDIYAWSNSPLGKVKVVIIGQDPYHGKGQAHGLCFSVAKGVQIPPSLKNIYKEIQAEYPEFKQPNHGNLMAWATNGVLLLNTCLTVKAHEANSHSMKGWENFTDKIIQLVDQYGGANLNNRGVGQGVVFMAWGAPAAKRVAKLDKKKHLILTSAHPSPLSAHRGFLGNGHFRKANEWLEGKYGVEATVDWCNLDVQ
ncbi:uracil-DNA glycosylase [Sistotremastrum niveocremeum HHB9708]|nr:uracil-DNA glycosylase [Sistotremastrum niveocremeum HHB9708]